MDLNTVQIWHRETNSLNADAEQTAARYLSIEEQDRANRFHFRDDRRDFIIAHDLLRRALSSVSHRSPADWQFVKNEHGKPKLGDDLAKINPLSFSLTHTRGCVACAVTTNSPVGVDIERVGRATNAQEIADRYFSDDEADWLRKCQADLLGVRFVELWTLKEAFLKANGIGWSQSLAKSITFRLSENAGIDFSPSCHIDRREWHFALFTPIPDLRIAVAVQSVLRPHFLMRQDGGDGHLLGAIRTSFSV